MASVGMRGAAPARAGRGLAGSRVGWEGIHERGRPLGLRRPPTLPARSATVKPSLLRRPPPPQSKSGAEAPDYVAETQQGNGAGPEGNGAEVSSTYTPEVKNYSPEFLRRRIIVFAGIIIGYSCYYLTRNSLGFAAPVMVADKSLNMDITKIGALTSIFPIFYGFSKFASGVLGARTPAHILLGSGLIATAAVNICFGFGTSLAWFSVFWAMNGLLQGLGGPCCARVLTNWWASGERGTYWGMWNIAHNVGGFLAPIIVGTVATKFGWRWGLWTPGIIGVIVGCAVLFAVQDNPTAVGYPAVEETVQEPKAEENGKPSNKPSLLDLLVQNVLKNPYIWGMALTYFFIYVIRQGVTSWFVFYLITAKGVGDAGSAAVRVSGMELGGLVGSLIAGRFSDWMILHAKPGQGAVGKRVQVVMMYTVGVAIALFAFWSLPGHLAWLQWVNVFMVGFFLYGPQMLIGLCGAELVGPESVGASEGFLGWVAYLGAANAGIPLSIIVKSFGWSYYFAALIAACGCALLLLAPMMNLKSHVQREDAKLKLKAA
ncbi:unnamed protein product [Ostreobium quekettii]|uniref:Major facilitator superfamily (MFS) profile domain-containing protein n=1 Tax=Ostreobium quekettii TaxID=121088 RepID=A0A8S1IKD2_9CHLO|nr:unnamed protein product [Ostreobium quekettii]